VTESIERKFDSWDFASRSIAFYQAASAPRLISSFKLSDIGINLNGFRSNHAEFHIICVF